MTTKITSQRDLLDLVNRVECTGCDYRDGPSISVPAELKTVEQAQQSSFYAGFVACQQAYDGPETPPRFVIVAQEPLLGEPWTDLDEGAFIAPGSLTDPGRWEYVVDQGLVDALELTR